MAKCSVCFRRCEIPEGGRGFCFARGCRDGQVVSLNYGRLTALALDPIEKKPLMRFHPGSMILSLGSWGCNLRCPFCQNHEISWSDEAMACGEWARKTTPEALVQAALDCRDRGNIGLAFTYNEPLIGWEFIRDTAARSREAGLLNVLVTNGSADHSRGKSPAAPAGPVRRPRTAADAEHAYAPRHLHHPAGPEGADV